MTLQWLPLDLSIYERQRQMPREISAVSEALTPRRTTAGVPMRGAGIMRGVSGAKGFVEKTEEKHALEAERKHELKLLDKQMEITKFQAGIREDERKFAAPITAGEALGREPAPTAALALTKETMPEAAKTMWDFILSLDEAGQKFFIQQLKEKELGTGGYVEAADKRIELPGSVGMYGHLVEQGLIDPATDTVIKREPEPMKGRFTVNPKTGEIYDTTTGKIVAEAGDVPPDWGVVYTEVLAEGLKYIKEMMDASWMQTMETEEMKAHMEEKKVEYRSWVAGRLFSRGMTDKDEINRLADLAIGSYDWQKHIDEAKAREEAPKGVTPTPIPTPAETNRGLPLDETVVAGLKEIFKLYPEDLDLIEQYKDEYGEINVNKALEKEEKEGKVVPPLKPPVKEKTWGEYKGKRRR